MKERSSIVKYKTAKIRSTEEKRIRQYIEGYRKQLENVSFVETKVRLKMAAEVFQKFDKWDVFLPDGNSL